jgi:Spy/CpxP family protein refolding chaperone
MNTKRDEIIKQIAVAAGFLALSLTPRVGRAQDSSQAAPQDQSQAAPAAPAHQEGRKNGEMAGLNLTDDQKAQMKQIHRATQSQMKAVNNDATLSADQKQTKIHQIRRGAHVQMVKLLTPEQREQMRENAKARRAARRRQGQQEPQSQATQPQPQGQ